MKFKLTDALYNSHWFCLSCHRFTERIEDEHGEPAKCEHCRSTRIRLQPAILEPEKKPMLITKQFVVSFQCAETTRWLFPDAEQLKTLHCLLASFATAHTTGPRPAVHVEILTQEQTPLANVA